MRITRRQFVAASSAAPFSMRYGLAATTSASVRAGDSCEFEIRINGQLHTVKCDSRDSLLDVLRDQLGLTGTKKGCDHGQCGACTVHLEGKRVLSCLTFAIAAQGANVLTIEG